MTPDPAALLAWYDAHARKLPWRVGPKERAEGVRPDPYRVWLSEIMLQQTGVAAVKPYFEAFLARWPNVGALAAAPRDELMKAWAGLGYYARARNLHACAAAVATGHGGVFPATAARLRELPGIGDYTASAIAAIAFDEPAAVVDGNVERVIARVFAIAEPLPAAKKTIGAHQARLTPKLRAGDYAQGLMDLGAMICTPKRPACPLCPFEDACAAHAAGTEEHYPARLEKSARPTRLGAAFVLVRSDGAVLLRRRADRGLLGGMTEVPGTEWAASPAPAPASRAPCAEDVRLGAFAAMPAADWSQVPGRVVHVFTHFRLELEVWVAPVPFATPAPNGYWWSSPDDLPGEALPSVMKKAIEAALPGATRRPRKSERAA